MEDTSLTTWPVMMMCIGEKKKQLSLEKECLCGNGQKVMGTLRGKGTKYSGLPGKFQFILFQNILKIACPQPPLFSKVFPFGK